VSLADDEPFVDVQLPDGVSSALMAHQLVVRAGTRDLLTAAIRFLREKYGTRLRVHADPTRY